MLAPPLTLGTITELSSGARTTRDRLLAETRRRAGLLAARGVGPGGRVAILHGQSASFFADLLATFHVGACAYVLDPALSGPELANLLEFVRADVVLVSPGSSVAVNAPTMACAEERSSTDAPPPAGRLDDPALCLFTSGTTGEPKGVVHGFRSLNARLALNRAHVGDARLRRTLCLLPTHFGHGLIGNALSALLAGGELFLTRFSKDLASALPAVLRDNDIRFMSSVPTMWRMILESSDAGGRTPLERVQLGSAPLSADLWRDVGTWTGCDDVVNVYGITETANWIGGSSSRERAPEDGRIGRAWGGVLAVREASGELRAHGAGELVVSSPSLMSGYLERPDLTAEVMEGGWFRTGDLGRVDEDGTAYLSGRLKNEINRAGAKIQPEDVDLVLERHPDVAESCTFGVPDELRGELVAAAIRSVSGALDLESLKAHCAANLRAHAVPERWYEVPEIPKTDRGKVRRATVRDFCLERRGEDG